MRFARVGPPWLVGSMEGWTMEAIGYIVFGLVILVWLLVVPCD